MALAKESDRKGHASVSSGEGDVGGHAYRAFVNKQLCYFYFYFFYSAGEDGEY